MAVPSASGQQPLSVHWQAIVAKDPARGRPSPGVDSGDVTGSLDVERRLPAPLRCAGSGLEHPASLLDRKCRPILNDGAPLSGPVDHREREEDQRNAGGHQDVTKGVVVHTG